MPTVWNALARRHAVLAAGGVSRLIANDDEMAPDGDLDQYLEVGRAAVEIILAAMLLARRERVSSILDLPSGAGRVTRHLREAFPEAALFVSDLNKSHQNFAARHFGATPIDVAPDFSDAPPRQFDVVFVGSLLTHLDETHFHRALAWFLDALAEDGLLIVTLHGRRNTRLGLADLGDRVRQESYARYLERGFLFDATEQTTPVPYGCARLSPSWLMRHLEREPRATVLGFLEAAWVDNQDALILRRRRLDATRPPRGSA